jgi:hypothetical protein
VCRYRVLGLFVDRWRVDVLAVPSEPLQLGPRRVLSAPNGWVDGEVEVQLVKHAALHRLQLVNRGMELLHPSSHEDRILLGKVAALPEEVQPLEPELVELTLPLPLCLELQVLLTELRPLLAGALTLGSVGHHLPAQDDVHGLDGEALSLIGMLAARGEARLGVVVAGATVLAGCGTRGHLDLSIGGTVLLAERFQIRFGAQVADKLFFRISRVKMSTPHSPAAVRTSCPGYPTRTAPATSPLSRACTPLR